MKRRLIGTLSFGLFVAAFPATAGAAETEATPLQRRVEQIREQIRAEPEKPEELFHDSFLAAVPPDRVRAILQQFHGMVGKVVRVTRTGSDQEHFGEFRFVSDRNKSFPVKIGVDPGPPHKINTLWFGLPTEGLDSTRAVLEKLDALPGKVSLALCALDGDAAEPRLALNPDVRLAVGSTFKIYVLGALLQAIEAQDRSWSDVVELRDAWKSWPSGVLHAWPEGSPTTLHSLAVQMISISDNTATDHLLYTLGRKRVERAMKAMGHGEPGVNTPFLSTRELFRIKELGRSAERVAAYLGRDTAGRRKYLDKTLAALPRTDFAGIDLGRPVAVDTVEWFASAADLCRAFDWVRRKTANDATARGILGVNPGLQFDDDAWNYVGFKGGSEPGVINLTWLLQRADGRWFGLSAGWNDASAAIDEIEFTSLLQSLVDLTARGPAAETGESAGTDQDPPQVSPAARGSAAR